MQTAMAELRRRQTFVSMDSTRFARRRLNFCR
jgi:hypothetical protein